MKNIILFYTLLFSLISLFQNSLITSVKATEYDNDILLLKAVQAGDLDAVKSLIKNGANPDTRDSEGTPVLVLSVCPPDLQENLQKEDTRAEIIQFLLDNGANINDTGLECSGAFDSAVNCTNLKAMEVLIANGINLDNYGYKDYDAFNHPVHYFLQSLNREYNNFQVAFWIETLSNHEKETSEYYSTPYTALISYDEEKQIYTFDKKHIEKMRQERQKKIAQILTLLINNNFDLIELICFNYTIDYYGASQQTTALMHTAFYGEIPAMKILLDNGAKVSTKTSTGNSALYYALNGVELEALDLLLKNGADINEKFVIDGVANNTVLTSIYYNTGYIHYKPQHFIDAIKLLISHGADVHAKNDEGKTALMHMLEIIPSNNKTPIGRTYLSDKDEDIFNEQIKKALPKEITRNTIEAMQILLDEEADINAVNNKGQNVLLYALEFWKFHVKSMPRYSISKLKYKDFIFPLEIIQFLLDNGVDINAKDNAGKTALDYAKEFEKETGERDVVELLLEHGAESGS